MGGNHRCVERGPSLRHSVELESGGRKRAQGKAGLCGDAGLGGSDMELCAGGIKGGGRGEERIDGSRFLSPLVIAIAREVGTGASSWAEIKREEGFGTAGSGRVGKRRVVRRGWKWNGARRHFYRSIV